MSQDNLTCDFVFKSEKINKDDDFGFFSGYASTFQMDKEGDVIAPNAFDDSIAKQDRLPLLWQHSSFDPIGSLEIKGKDQNGLIIEGRVNLGTSLGRDAFALIKAGDLNKMSIGALIKEASNNNNGGRELEKLDLMEVSVVTFPANEGAAINNVKSIKFDNCEDINDIEKKLKQCGLSNKQSKSIISNIWNLKLKSSSAVQPNIEIDDAEKKDIQENIDKEIDDIIAEMDKTNSEILESLY